MDALVRSGLIRHFNVVAWGAGGPVGMVAHQAFTFIGETLHLNRFVSFLLFSHLIHIFSYVWQLASYCVHWCD